LKKQKEEIIIKNENSRPSIILGAPVSNTQLGVLNIAQSFLNKIKGTDFQESETPEQLKVTKEES